MRVIALIMCSLALAAANSFTSWELFKAQYDRHYLDVEEEHYRQSVFEKNLEFINDFNKRFEQGEVTFNLKMNQFGDMTNEEFNAIKGYEIEPRHSSMAAPSMEENEKAAEVDWREKGAVNPVVDQGMLGASWAFSATGALEGQHFLKTGTLVNLSEQQLVDCMDSYFPGVTEAFTYVQENGGINTDAIYPSGIPNGTCRYKPDVTDATCSGYVITEAGNESALESAVRDIGPISVEIDASHISFQFYSSGVYYEPACSPSLLDHAMLIVGYGTVSGEDYWIVKNSWGTGWGESGYINMARNRDNNCGIASDASYPLP
ncbi:digestive cysteine proteinase 2 [Procambarus clarkii]|uniref:digestive cysteine proteinase 2 n=1 Tax=Procambarus clarkii TaxID=6728 RepID=UPI001E670E6B|nr:digestive cysteine proteinase 2-like [Procambarus clarkii]